MGPTCQCIDTRPTLARPDDSRAHASTSAGSPARRSGRPSDGGPAGPVHNGRVSVPVAAPLDGHDDPLPPAATVVPRLREQRAFAVLFAGATLARLATEMQSVAVVLFVLAETHSAQVAGLTVAAATLPTVVTGPLVGAWLDHTPRRRAAFLVSPLVLVAAMVGFLAAVARVPGAALVALGFVAGLPSPVRTGGFSGLIPTVVPEPVLPRAYGMEAASYNIAGIGGPALAGAVAGLAGSAWAIAATAVVALASFVVIAQVPITPAAPAGRRPLRAALREGFAVLWSVRPLRAVTVATTVSQGWFGLAPVAFPLLVHDMGHKRAVGGVMFSVFAVGALLGSMLWTRVAGRLDEERATFVAMVLFGGGLTGIALAPGLAVALATAFAAGLVDGPMLAATLHLRQRWSPERVLTQVFTTAASMKIGAFAVGSALAGSAAGAVGPRGMLALVAAGQAVAVSAGLVVRRM